MLRPQQGLRQTQIIFVLHLLDVRALSPTVCPYSLHSGAHEHQGGQTHTPDLVKGWPRGMY